MVATAIFGLCCNIVNLIALGDCSCKEEEDDGFGNDSPKVSDALNSSNSSIIVNKNDDDENLNVRAAMIHMVGDLV